MDNNNTNTNNSNDSNNGGNIVPEPGAQCLCSGINQQCPTKPPRVQP